MFLGAIPVAFLASFAVGWFHPLSSVGISDWDLFFSYAWLSAEGLVERGFPPLWSIQLAGGAPLAGDPAQSLSHSPFVLFPLLLGPIIGIKVLVVLLIAAGFVGCRSLGLRWIGDALGATVFAFAFVFSGHFAVHFRVGHLPWAAFYLVPWILLFVDRLLFDPGRGLGASIGLIVSLVLLFTGTVYHALVFFLLPVALVYGFIHGRRARSGRMRHVLVLLLCAVALAMPRLLPVIAWEWYDPRHVLGHGGMPLLRIAEMLTVPIPDYKYRPTWLGGEVWEYWSYTGIVISMLAIVSLRIRERWQTFGIACFVAAVILAWRPPWGNVLGWMALHVPFLSSVRCYSRFLVVATFAIALLAGGTIGTLRSTMRGPLAWLPVVLLLAVIGDSWLFVRPIWSKVFALPLAEVYPDWGVTIDGKPYSEIRLAPPHQAPTGDEEGFSSRMLPLLMAGAIVGNAYVAPALPWTPPADGSVVEGLPDTGYRLRNHEIDLHGDFRPGQEIRIKLRYAPGTWKIVDRTAARIDRDAGAMKVVILRPCQHVRITVRTGLEIVGWVVSGIGFACTAIVLRREWYDRDSR